MTSRPTLSRRLLLAAPAPLLLSSLVGCGGASAGSTTPSVVAATRTVTHDLGQATIVGVPQRIVSTSVVLTGTLLALDAPVVGSGASMPNAQGFDDQGFFTHWSDVARKRGVTALYKQSQLDIEAVVAARPDLIVISSTGGDSTRDAYEALAKIAPTVAINYNSTSWKDVTREVAAVTGTQARADSLVGEFDTLVTTLKKDMKGVPTEKVQAIVYNPSGGLSFAKPGGPHDEIFAALGFTLAEAPESSGAEGGNRKDFVFATEEQSRKALTSKTLLLVSGDEQTVAQLKADPSYNTSVTVSEGRLVPLGVPSFKLDYYSAVDMVQHLARAYSA